MSPSVVYSLLTIRWLTSSPSLSKSLILLKVCSQVVIDFMKKLTHSETIIFIFPSIIAAKYMSYMFSFDSSYYHTLNNYIETKDNCGNMNIFELFIARNTFEHNN